jgi:hypothetical protein
MLKVTEKLLFDILGNVSCYFFLFQTRIKLYDEIVPTVGQMNSSKRKVHRQLVLRFSSEKASE